MSSDVALSCACGSVRGTAELSPSAGLRLVCYCTDCQTYAHHMGREAEILDASGGTEVFQTTPRRIKIETGHEHIRSLRQSPKGALRFYAGCCNSPIANGLSNPRVAFSGLVGSFLSFESEAERSKALGPVQGAVQTETARGPLLHRKASPLLMARIMGNIGLKSLTGHHRPTPFFDDEGRPCAEPELMARDAREALQARVQTPATSPASGG